MNSANKMLLNQAIFRYDTGTSYLKVVEWLCDSFEGEMLTTEEILDIRGKFAFYVVSNLD